MKDTHEDLESHYLPALPGDRNLFHYTDANGLIGMADKRKLWMSNLNYLNDSEEYYYTFNLTKEVLEEKYRGLLDFYEIRAETSIISSVFSFSLSEREDLLSQWRGYCPDGGFSFSFDVAQFNEIIERENLRVAKCMYDKEEQIEFIIRHVIGFTPAEYEEELEKTRAEGQENTHRFNYHIKHLWRKIHIAAPLLKHPSFSEEKEWRVFKNINGYSSLENPTLSQAIRHYPPHHPSEVKLRASKNKLIPYIEIDLTVSNKEYNSSKEPSVSNKEYNNLNIQELIVGPTPHKEAALEAALTFVEVTCLSGRKGAVRMSEIPYVTW